MFHQKSLSVPQQLLIALCLAHLVLNIAWLGLNSAPIAWDQAGHTRLAVEFARYFQGTLNKDVSILTLSSYYPPLTHLVSSAFILLLGPSVFVATFPITLYFITLLIGLFLLIRHLTKDEWVALITVLFLSLLPPIYESSRSFLLEIPLLTVLVYSWYFLVKTEYLSKARYVFVFALLTVAVLLTKWIGIVLLVVPLVAMIYHRWKKGWKRQQSCLLAAWLVLTIICVSPWYTANFNRLIEIGKLASQGEITDPQQILSLDNIFYYFSNFLNFQLTLWPALICIGSMVIYFLKKSSPYKLFLAVFLISGYAVFTIISNKDIRYTLPLLPAIVYMPSYLLVKWWKNKRYVQSMVVGASLCLLLIQYLVLSFHLLPPFQRAWQLGPFGWIDYINTTDIIVKYPKHDQTPNRAILKYLTLRHPNDSISVMVGIDQNDMNPSTLDLFITLNNYWQVSLEAPYNITSGFESENEINHYLSRFDYIVIPTGEVGPDAVRHKKALEQIRDYVINNRGVVYAEIKYFKLNTRPGEVLIFKHVNQNT